MPGLINKISKYAVVMKYLSAGKEVSIGNFTYKLIDKGSGAEIVSKLDVTIGEDQVVEWIPNEMSFYESVLLFSTIDSDYRTKMIAELNKDSVDAYILRRGPRG